LALASYPGFHVTTPPGDGGPYGIYTAAFVDSGAVEHFVVLPGGERVGIEPARTTMPLEDPPEASLPEPHAGGAATTMPLGAVAGARSGDKGGSANIGVWARNEEGWRWLSHFLTVDRLRSLLPETAALPVTGYLLPNLRALNFVVDGLLGEGVASSTRFDPQGKALGEWLRSRLVPIPDALIDPPRG